jgi:predicted DNA-binding transcriptional regulator YafY
MGVPIETVEGSLGAGGIDGYRVRGDEYALPEVRFTAAELTVLGLAARVWEQASLGPAARSALRKLEASGEVARRDPAGVIARVTTPEPAFPALLAAAQARAPVRFDYRKSGEVDAEPRRLEPWAVLARRGHWYVVGQDRDRDAARVFRLSRIVGDVTPDGKNGSYEVPAGATIRDVVRSVADGPQTPAVLRVRQGQAASLRRRAEDAAAEAEAADAPEGWDTITVSYGDDEVFAEDLVGYGADVVVLAPAGLRDAVVRRLRAALQAAQGAA